MQGRCGCSQREPGSRPPPTHARAHTHAQARTHCMFHHGPRCMTLAIHICPFLVFLHFPCSLCVCTHPTPLFLSLLHSVSSRHIMAATPLQKTSSTRLPALISTLFSLHHPSHFCLVHVCSPICSLTRFLSSLVWGSDDWLMLENTDGLQFTDPKTSAAQKKINN